MNGRSQLKTDKISVKNKMLLSNETRLGLRLTGNTVHVGLCNILNCAFVF